MPIGEGGAVASSDQEFADRVRAMRLHGMSKDSWKRYLPGGSWRYDVKRVGLKANMTDVQAAIGRAQLAALPGWQEQRADIVRRYDEALKDLPGLVLPSGTWPGSSTPGTSTRSASRTGTRSAPSWRRPGSRRPCTSSRPTR